jgi:large subunit ribosomal protein L9
MKVILKDNIENLGKKGDIVKVAPGYGRNYLLPKKMALEVTATNMKMIEMVQTSLRKGLEKEMKVYLSLIEKLNAVTLTFTRKAGEKDSIFGSVSVTDIRDALAELGFDIEKKRILLAEPLKRLGNYTVPIKVFHDDRAEIKLEVAREGGPEEAPAPEPEAAMTPAAEEAELMPATEVSPVAAETVVEPEVTSEAPESPAEEPAAPSEVQPEVSEPEAVQPETEPEAEAKTPEPAAEMPEPEAETSEAEKPEEALDEEPETKTPDAGPAEDAASEEEAREEEGADSSKKQ